MDYYGLLFLYYLKGLSGKSVLKLFFNIEAGGTEQLLPENTSTPTTTPILADIQYPDGLRTDQYFTYRETPTTVSNKARIKTIKGNTLVWNQLVKNGNFADSSRWAVRGSATINSVANNVLTFTASAQGGGVYSNVSMAQTHKYLYVFEYQSSEQIAFNISGQSSVNYEASSSFKRASAIIQWSATTGEWQLRILSNATSNFSAIKIRNVMLFDLTQMGLDITDPSDFTSLFPLPYYSYNQGSLLSFMGNGIKTVGFNQWDGNSENGKWINDYSTGAVSTADSTYNVTDFIHAFPNTTYYHTKTGSRRMMFYDGNKNPIPMTSWQYPDDTGTIVSPPDAHYIRFTITDYYLNNFWFNISDQSKDGTYESYTSSTLSLPISTYFPTGMKSAGSVYDELTESKATARLKETTFSSVSAFDSSGKLGVLGEVTDAVDITTGASTMPNDKSVFETYSLSGLRNNDVNGITQYGKYLYVRLQGKTTLAEYNTYLSANPLTVIYELATPTETPITTEDANEALSLLMGKSVSSSNAKQMIDIITKGE